MWFIISGDGVRPYVQNKTNRSKSSTTFQASTLVGAWAWIIVDSSLVYIILIHEADLSPGR